MEDDRLWKFRRPEWLNSVWARNAGIYASGALFSIAFYVMLDSAVWSKSSRNGSNVHVKFVDWLPLVFSSLGMLIINSVEKQRLSADSFSYSGSGVAWKARVVLFLGFAALAGGMAGGVTVFVLKFAVPGVAMPALGMGIENLVSNALIGIRRLRCALGQPEHGGRVLLQPLDIIYRTERVKPRVAARVDLLGLGTDVGKDLM
ncbi:hypothetical protein E4U55_002750 [Claviceps digitariae]|nr:hypothetical protein E4U55_002750 [Claviceps digitariae]